MFYNTKRQQILAHQQSYIDHIVVRETKMTMTKTENLMLQTVIFLSTVGLLSWVASQTRSDITFEVCHLNTD